MSIELLTEHHLEFLGLKEVTQARLSLFMSKCHIVGNHMSRLIYVDTISIDLSILYLMGCTSKFLFNGVFLSLKMVFILANSADPDEMPLYAAFHLGLHCLSKC